MFRRPRFSVRPKVGTPSKTPQEATPEAGETPKDEGESSTAAAAAVTDSQSVVTSPEKPAAPGDGNEQNAEGTGSSAAVQRRKRFSIKPKVAPGRPSAAARMQKTPVKAASETPVEVPVEVPVSDLDKPTTSSQTGTAAAPQRLLSPRRRGSSEDGKQQPKVQPKAALVSSDGSEPSADSATNPPADGGKGLESGKKSESVKKGVKGAPSRLPDKAPFIIPDREAIELSEKARTLVSSKSRLSMSQPAFSLSRLLNDPSDLQRIAKAQKLRDLLRQEMHKEKKLKKGNTRVQELTLDPAKMTMRDLIRYLPLSNPMTSSLEEPAPENETVIPPSPAREASLENAKEPVVLPKIGSPREVEEEEGEGEEDEDEDEEDGTMVPRVKVAEDGTLIIDEESLTVEVLRAKGPNPAHGRDPIFERGSTTTYSSFRKGTYTKPWSSEETDMFFLAISMVGTDFSMICQLFPLRTRSEIKNKFKKEERENSWRVDKAFRERRKLDIEYFTKLLEKILEVHKTRKKLKSLAAKNSPKKTARKPRGKKAPRKPSAASAEEEEEEEDEKGEDEIADLMEEGEKENEEVRSEGGADAAKPKKKRKRKSRDDEGPDDKKNKAAERSNERDEACVPGDAEAALPEDCPTSDMCEDTETAKEATSAKIKPAKLSRGRAPKPAVSKPPPASTKAAAAAAAPDEEDPSVADGDAEDKVDKGASSPVSQAEGKKSPTEDSEEEDAVVRPQRPTRSGRVPKPVQLLNYPAKEAAASAATRPASPDGSAGRPKPKSATKRGRPPKLQSSQESKKPKLVTLRASQSEYSEEEEDEKQRGAEEEEQEGKEEERPAWGSGEDATAPVFVPASLRSPQPVIPEVEETMEELDILAHIPDVLGISQNETGTAESCEHQLDLLVDVIDFLSADPTEVSENESYNEAAQTLLTIGNMAHLSPSDHTAGTTSADVNETSQHLEEEIAAKPAVLEEAGAAPSPDRGATETSVAVPVVEPPSSATDNDDVSVIEPVDRRTDFETDPPSQSPERSTPNPPQTRTGRSAKLKPKPNLGQASRTAQSKLPPGTSTGRRAEKSRAVAPDLARTTETPSAAEESPEIADENMLKDDVSSIEVKRAEEPSGSQERPAGEVQSDAATSDRSASENQRRCFSEARSEPGADGRDSGSTSGPTEEAPTAEGSCDNPVTSDTAVAEPRGSNEHSAPAQESGGHVAAPVEDLPVNRKEESKVESTQPVRKSRFQKIKPKLNLAPRTLRCQPQTTKDAAEKDSQPTPPNPQIHEETTAEVRPMPEPTRTELDFASDLTPFVNLRWTLAPMEEPSTTEEEKVDVGVVGRSESDAATSHQQNIPVAQSTPRREPATRDTMLTLESLGAAESSCNDPESTSDSVAAESLARGSNMESGDRPVAPAEEPPVGAKEDKDVASTFHSPRRRLQKVKPKPNVPQTSRTARSEPPTAKDSAAPLQRAETSGSESTDDAGAVAEARPTCSAAPPDQTSPIKSTSDTSASEPSGELRSTPETAEETSSCEPQKTDVGSEPNAPQRRQRFARVKPTLASSPRTTRAKLQARDVSKPAEQAHVDTPSSSEPDLTSTLASLRSEPFSPTKSVSTVSEASQAEHSSPSSLTITEYWGAENWSQYTDLVLENMCSKEEEEGASLRDGTANSDDVEAGPAARWGRDRDVSVGSAESETRPADDPIATSDVKSSESILPASTRPTAASKESARQPPAEAECEAAAAAAAASPDVNQQRSDTDQTAAQSSDVHPSETTDSPSREAPQARRGRLVKPKPRLVRGGRPPQPRQVQNVKQAETDVAAGSEAVDAELQPDIPDPAEGAVEHSFPKDAGSSPGRGTQVPDRSPQDSSTSSAGATQSLCMPSQQQEQQELSDPDEQFFILSLTEIPVSTLSEPMDRVPEPILCLSVTDAPIEQQSAPGEAALPRVPAPTSTEESVETDARTTQPGWIAENPVQPPETSTVHASKSPETPELKDESETPPEQPGGAPAARRRRAKEPAKPKTAKRKQAGKTPPTRVRAAAAAELPEPSLQPEAAQSVTQPHTGSDECADVAQNTPAGGGDAEDGGSGARATRTRATRSQDGKPKGFPSVTSATGDAAGDAPAGRAASKARAPRAAGKRAAAAPATSTPHSASSSSTTAPPAHTPDTPDTPEVSASQESDFGEEEPTSVSQYFLSDIFTDVEG